MRQMHSIQGAMLTLWLAAAQVASAADPVRRLDLDNDTGGQILEVYVSPSQSPKWGNNLLTEGALHAGGRVTVSFTGACGLYDVRIVAPGGREYLDDEVSLCDEDDALTVGKAEITKARRSERK